VNSKQALEKLKAGNQKYVNSDNTPANHEYIAEQKPFAVVLSCADSRVPAEAIFNQGVGDIFVVRVAGNIATPSQIGSIEFACENFGSSLIVVLGHSGCGAIKASIGCSENGTDGLSPSLKSIVDEILPAIEPVLNNAEIKPAELLQASTKANVEKTILDITNKSSLLKGLVDQGNLEIIGAEFSVETGLVNFYNSN